MSSELQGNGPDVHRTLPVHGFVLAGGKSLRMGVDKATLTFCGRPMVELAVEKLSGFCASVSIVGDRDDLAKFASIVHGERSATGPGAGIEAGLRASTEEWALFLPADAPLVPAALLRAWVQAQLAARTSDTELLRDCGAQLPWVSYLSTLSGPQPSICLLHCSCLRAVTESLDAGVRKLEDLLGAVQQKGGVQVVLQARQFAGTPVPTEGDVEFWFSNLNTPHALAEAETLARR